VAKEFLWSQAVFQGEGGNDWLGLIEMEAPEIVRDFVQDVALLCDEFRIEKSAAFKRPISQHPLSETMNRINGSTIKTLQGDGKPALRLLV